MGLDTPEQCFVSFRTAIRANLVVHEYRSFSEDFKARNGGFGLLQYEEVRDELFAGSSIKRWAISRAEDPEVVVAGPDVAYVQSRIPGFLWVGERWLVLRMVRQGFCDVWLEQDPEAPAFGRNVDDPIATGNLFSQAREDGRQYVYGAAQVPLDPGLVPVDARFPDDVHRIEVGWEWKIDGFEPLDARRDLEEWLRTLDSE